MGKAIIDGVLSSGKIAPEHILVCDLDAEKLKTLPSGVATVTSVSRVKDCEYVIFAVKPQSFSSVASEFSEDSTVISIMAGIKIDRIKSLTKAREVVRIMPNTPCLVGKGMCAVAFSGVTEKKKEFVTELFNTLGKVVEVEEDKMDAVTSVSGSGPAYVYYFINSMINAGMNRGLDAETARTLTLQTFEGALEMVKTSSEPIDTLIRNVCSKGGTTIQAIEHFKNGNLSDIIDEGMAKCAHRSKEMSEEL